MQSLSAREDCDHTPNGAKINADPNILPKAEQVFEEWGALTEAVAGERSRGALLRQLIAAAGPGMTTWQTHICVSATWGRAAVRKVKNETSLFRPINRNAYLFRDNTPICAWAPEASGVVQRRTLRTLSERTMAVLYEQPGKPARRS